MSQTSKEGNGLCQLQTLPAAGPHPTRLDRTRLVALRLTTAVQRRLGGGVLPPPIIDGPKGDTAASSDPATIDVGDWVEVRSMEEIRQTFDEPNRCRGLEFMRGMDAYCGQRLQVKKRIRAIFDERAWRMLKLRDSFLLEGCVCSGRGMYEKEGCDRCCYFFWRQAWLKKV